MTEWAIVSVVVLAGAFVLTFFLFQRKLSKERKERIEAELEATREKEKSRALASSPDEQLERMRELIREREEFWRSK